MVSKSEVAIPECVAMKSSAIDGKPPEKTLFMSPEITDLYGSLSDHSGCCGAKALCRLNELLYRGEVRTMGFIQGEALWEHLPQPRVGGCSVPHHRSIRLH
jgi:hypothetical protein